jgi:dimethylargininase
MLDVSCVTRFNQAIVRLPSRSVEGGLRAVDTGNPVYAAVLAEHEAYVLALRAAGVKITVLPALEAFPDAVFVEDPALVFSAGAILLRSSMSARAGETRAIRPALERHFDTVLSLPSGGFVEGGDVLVTPKGVMIGLSERTDRQGAEGLLACLDDLGIAGQIVQTPQDVLHFKTDCSLLDETTVLATTRLARSGVFEGFNTVLVPKGEEAAANALRVNDVVLVGAQFSQTIRLLQQKGYDVVPLDTREIGKIDAGLSCMSLRWQQNMQ